MTDDKKNLALVALAGLLASTTATAQEQIIERCKQTSSKDDRIACLEAALLMRDDASARQIDAPSLQMDSGQSDAEVAEKEPPSPTQAAEAAATPQPAVTAPAAQAQPTGIGAEQVIARQQTQEERIASLKRSEGLEVAGYRELAFGRLQVTLKNGQVWEQIKGDTRKVRVDLRRNQTVNIEESSFGGYKLRLNEMQREIRVRRVN